MELLPKARVSQLELVAQQRALGLRWEAVATKVGRRAETIRRWPTRYPETWRRVYRAAECRLIAEAGAEARSVLRSLLWIEDDRVRCNAGKFLAALQEKVYQQGCKLEAATQPEDDEWARYFAYVRGMTDEEALEFVEDFVDRYRAEHSSTPGASLSEPQPTQDRDEPV
jgi:hypothetical protein